MTSLFVGSLHSHAARCVIRQLLTKSKGRAAVIVNSNKQAEVYKDYVSPSYIHIAQDVNDAERLVNTIYSRQLVVERIPPPVDGFSASMLLIVDMGSQMPDFSNTGTSVKVLSNAQRLELSVLFVCDQLTEVGKTCTMSIDAFFIEPKFSIESWKEWATQVMPNYSHQCVRSWSSLDHQESLLLVIDFVEKHSCRLFKVFSMDDDNLLRAENKTQAHLCSRTCFCEHGDSYDPSSWWLVRDRLIPFVFRNAHVTKQRYKHMLAFWQERTVIKNMVKCWVLPELASITLSYL